MDPIQNQGLRLSLGAFRTSPTASLHVEAGIPPLSIRRKKLSLQYAVRVLANEKNPTHKAIFEKDHSVFEGVSITVSPLTARVSAMVEEAGITNDMVMKVGPSKSPPWTLGAPTVLFDLAAGKKEETSCATYMKKLKEVQDKHKNFAEVYTDGSKDAVKGNHCYAERLADEASIYTAEIHALYLAQDHVETSISDKHLICSDSKSSLTAMETKKWKHPLVRKLLVRHHQLTEQGKEIVYIWVPGHTGIRGNDLADTAAKKATDLQPSRDAEIPSSDLKPKVNGYIHRKWQTEWDSKIGNKLHSIQPSIGIIQRCR